MNKSRRKRLEKLMNSLETLKDELEEIKDEEQEAYDNLPESIQSSERGETMSEVVDALDGAFSYLEATLGELGSIE